MVRVWAEENAVSTRPSLSFNNGGCAPVVRNCAEFGFADGRTGNPNQAWEALRALPNSAASFEMERQ